MEWISVKDRLPSRRECNEEGFGVYLCLVVRAEKCGRYSKNMEVIEFSALTNTWFCEGSIVTHWMPLPDYPKEGGVI